MKGKISSQLFNKVIPLPESHPLKREIHNHPMVDGVTLEEVLKANKSGDPGSLSVRNIFVKYVIPNNDIDTSLCVALRIKADSESETYKLSDKEYQILLGRDHKLGKGASGKIRICLGPNGEKLAAKIVYLANIDDPDLLEVISKELTLIQGLDDRYFVGCKESFISMNTDGKWFACSIMEYMDKGNFETFISNRPSPYDEDDFRAYLIQCLGFLKNILEGLSILASLNIVHKSLKPANILLEEKDGTISAKLSGFSRTGFELPKNLPEDLRDKNLSRQESELNTLGAPAYVSPEEIMPFLFNVTPKADLFSFGLILFEVITGQNIYMSNIPKGQILVDYACTLGLDVNEYTFPKEFILLPEVKNLIIGLTQLLPDDRISHLDALNHPAFTEPIPDIILGPTEDTPKPLSPNGSGDSSSLSVAKPVPENKTEDKEPESPGKQEIEPQKTDEVTLEEVLKANKSGDPSSLSARNIFVKYVNPKNDIDTGLSVALRIKADSESETYKISDKEYKILLDEEHRLGEGTFGKVQLCFDPNGEKLAAKIVKIKNIDDLDRLENISKEFTLIQGLDDRYFVGCKESFISTDKDGKWFACSIMEYMDKGDFGEFISKMRPPSYEKDKFKDYVSQCLGFLNNILKGLSILASLNILHKDLKPANILLKIEEDGTISAKISDFDCAAFELPKNLPKNLLNNILDRQEKELNSPYGTDTYKSPEVIIPGGGLFPVTPKADLFSFGLILFEAIMDNQIYLYPKVFSNNVFFGQILTWDIVLSSILGFDVNKFTFPEEFDLFPEVKALIIGLLQQSSEDRISHLDALNHPPFKKPETEAKEPEYPGHQEIEPEHPKEKYPIIGLM